MWVCIPGLHLSLGMYNHLWPLLVDACNKFDLKLADGGGRAGGASFIQYSYPAYNTKSPGNHVGAVDHLNGTQPALPDPESNPTLSAFRHEASVAHQLADSLVRYDMILQLTLCPLNSLPLTIRSSGNLAPRMALSTSHSKRV